MADKARKQTDKELNKLEREIYELYATSQNEIAEKWREYMSSHKKSLDKAYKELEDAKKSGDKDAIKTAQEQYERAVRNVTLNDNRYKAMLNETTAKLANVNQTALDYVNNDMPKIYTLNYNAFGDEKIDGYSFALVNERAVANLAQSDKIELPYKKVDVSKDKAWNAKNINSQLIQGILQGESIPKISARLQNVTDMNRSSSIRNARTMVTGAENKGRQDSFEKAQSDGVIMKRVWVATSDERTRAWHADLDGVEVDIDEPWENEYGEIMYPGDPTADGANIYNCRCSIRSVVKGFKWNEEENATESKLTEVKSINPELFKDSNTKNGNYAYELAKDTSPVRYDEEHEFILKNGDNIAFVDIWEDEKSLEIETMGSTGGGTGTEIFIEMMERADEKDLDFTWLADHKSAMDYYSHLGLDKYIDKKYSDSSHHRYNIPASELEKVIKELNATNVESVPASIGESVKNELQDLSRKYADNVEGLSKSDVRDKFIDKDSYVNSSEYREAFDLRKANLKEQEDIINQINDLEEKLKQEEAVPKPRSEWTAEDMMKSVLGKKPMIQSDESRKLEKEIDTLWKKHGGLSGIVSETNDKIERLDKRNYLEQIKNWKSTKPVISSETQFEGFSTRMGINQFDEDLANGIGYISEMSPKEYLERCAYDVFDTTYESTVLGANPDSILKYAKQMSEGVEFDMGYLDYGSKKQEGRHRAMAAELLGIEKIPVYIRGK